jgi:iron-sulfur cluster assembly accessory protein
MEREGRRGAGNPETGSIEWRESNAADRRGNWFASFSLRPVRMSSEITSTGLVDSPGLADNPGFAGNQALADNPALAGNQALAGSPALAESPGFLSGATTGGRATLAEAPAAAGSSPSTITHTGVDGRGILITDSAMRQLAQLIRQQGDDRVLRVGVRSGGCSGMSYTMDFIPADQIRSDDEIYTYDPSDAPTFRVVSDPKSLLYIYGMQLDFSTALIGGGFNFTNPNASQTCGCGSSFAV